MRDRAAPAPASRRARRPGRAATGPASCAVKCASRNDAARRVLVDRHALEVGADDADRRAVDGVAAGIDDRPTSAPPRDERDLHLGGRGLVERHRAPSATKPSARAESDAGPRAIGPRTTRPCLSVTPRAETARGRPRRGSRGRRAMSSSFAASTTCAAIMTPGRETRARPPSPRRVPSDDAELDRRDACAVTARSAYVPRIEAADAHACRPSSVSATRAGQSAGDATSTRAPAPGSPVSPPPSRASAPCLPSTMTSGAPSRPRRAVTSSKPGARAVTVYGPSPSRPTCARPSALGARADRKRIGAAHLDLGAADAARLARSSPRRRGVLGAELEIEPARAGDDDDHLRGARAAGRLGDDPVLGVRQTAKRRAARRHRSPPRRRRERGRRGSRTRGRAPRRTSSLRVAVAHRDGRRRRATPSRPAILRQRRRESARRRRRTSAAPASSPTKRRPAAREECAERVERCDSIESRGETKSTTQPVDAPRAASVMSLWPRVLLLFPCGRASGRDAARRRSRSRVAVVLRLCGGSLPSRLGATDVAAAAGRQRTSNRRRRHRPPRLRREAGRLAVRLPRRPALRRSADDLLRPRSLGEHGRRRTSGTRSASSSARSCAASGRARTSARDDVPGSSGTTSARRRRDHARHARATRRRPAPTGRRPRLLARGDARQPERRHADGRDARAVTPTLARVAGQDFVILATDGAPNCNSERELRLRPVPARTSENVPGCPEEGPFNCCEPPDGFRENCTDSGSTLAAHRPRSSKRDPCLRRRPSGRSAVRGAPRSDGDRRRHGPPTSPKYFAVDAASERPMLTALKQIAAQITGTCMFDLKEQPANARSSTSTWTTSVLPYEPANGWTIRGKTVTLVGDACDRREERDVLDVRIIAGCPRVRPN